MSETSVRNRDSAQFAMSPNLPNSPGAPSRQGGGWKATPKAARRGVGRRSEHL
ncbi:MAG TPA: hypothetical protein VIO58_04160 [Candidatus Methanoperedens sp.]